MPESLKLLPLGGLGEIGMNCMVLEWKGQFVVIDCGSQFPDPKYLGADMLVPDFRYICENRKGFLGAVVTHAHEDHIGSITALAHHMDFPVYGTAYPLGLVKKKLEEYSDVKNVDLREVSALKPFDVGPFNFELLPVQHSIVEAHGLGIRTPVGNLVHSGDFKTDPDYSAASAVSLEPFERWGKEGVLCFLSDSTNSEVLGRTLSEDQVAESLATHLDRQEGRYLVALFASNVQRISNLLHLAKERGKKVAFAGRSLHTYISLAHELNAIDIPEDTLILLENMEQVPRKDLILVVTGSQAEPQSALLRIAYDQHKQIKLGPGDTVIMSSKFIPGNERSISTMINQICRLKAKVLFGRNMKIHASGHAAQDELSELMGLVNPKYFLPVHGELRHLYAHADLAVKNGIDPTRIKVVENGQEIFLSSEGLALGEKRELERGIIAGGFYREGCPEVFQRRGKLGRSGVVSVTWVRDKKTGALQMDPQVKSEGILLRRDQQIDSCHEDLSAHLKSMEKEIRKQSDSIEATRLEVRRFFKKRASHKPEVISFEIEV